jgi:hypothetical protein
MEAAVIALAILIGSLIIGRDLKMAVDPTAFNEALQEVADGLAALAESIANVPAEDTSGQEALDAATERLQSFASTLGELKVAEDAEDAG